MAGLTLRELAGKLDVSVATVSRALAGDQAIALKTRERVAEAARRYGYVPNVAARQLVSGRSGFIGFVMPIRGPNFIDAYLGDFVTGLGEGLVEHGVDLFIATVQSGIMLWARATAGADRTFASLTLRPRLTHLTGMDEVPWDRSPRELKLTVKRPNLLASELATTANVRDGKTLLLGGLKGYVGKDGAGGKPQNVLLLVKPTLIVQREVQERQFPLLGERKADQPAR